MAEPLIYKRGDKVRKVGGDAGFEGTVVSAYYKLNGTSARYDVEDERGLLLIQSNRTLELVERKPPMTKLQDKVRGVLANWGVKTGVPPLTDEEAKAAVDEGMEWLRVKIEKAARARVRARLAAQAMQSLVQAGPNLGAQEIARRSVALADAMLEELKDKDDVAA